MKKIIFLFFFLLFFFASTKNIFADLCPYWGCANNGSCEGCEYDWCSDCLPPPLPTPVPTLPPIPPSSCYTCSGAQYCSNGDEYRTECCAPGCSGLDCCSSASRTCSPVPPCDETLSCTLTSQCEAFVQSISCATTAPAGCSCVNVCGSTPMSGWGASCSDGKCTYDCNYCDTTPPGLPTPTPIPGVCKDSFESNFFHACYYPWVGTTTPDNMTSQSLLAQADDTTSLPTYPLASPVGAAQGFLHNWITGVITPTTRSDGVSVVWRGKINFDENKYIFHTWNDDGIQVEIEGIGKVIDRWYSPPGFYDSIEYNLKGEKNITVKYFDITWTAAARFWWTASPTCNVSVSPSTISQGGTTTVTLKGDTNTTVARDIKLIFAKATSPFAAPWYLPFTGISTVTPAATLYLTGTYYYHFISQDCTTYPCNKSFTLGNVPIGNYQLFCLVDNPTVGSDLGGGIDCTGDPICATPPNGGTLNCNSWGRIWTDCHVDGSTPPITDHASLTVTTPGPWFQTQGGDVHAQGSIKSTIPSLVPAAYKYFSLDSIVGSLLLSHPGVVSSKTALSASPFGAGDTSTKKWLANSDYDLSKYSYDYFYKKLNSPTTPVFSDNVPAAGSNLVYYFSGNIDLNRASWKNFPANTKAIVFINGDLNIKKEVIVPTSSFLMFIVKGNINIAGTLGDKKATTTPHLEGIYLAYKKTSTLGGIINTNEPTDSSGNRLVGAGVFFAEAGFSMSRSLKNAGSITDSTTPAEQFIFRPDLVLRLPSTLWVGTTSWQEVAP